MKYATLINLRILSACFTLLSAHGTAMAYVYGYPQLANRLLYAFGILTLITCCLLFIKPAGLARQKPGRHSEAVKAQPQPAV